MKRKTKMKELEDLTLVSLNTQSLGTGTLGVRKRAELKRYLAGTTPRADVVLIQEHHLPIQDCIQKGNKLLYRGGLGLWNDATYSAQSQRHQGGTTILLSAKSSAILERAWGADPGQNAIRHTQTNKNPTSGYH